MDDDRMHDEEGPERLSTLAESDVVDEALVACAREARDRAYAPYSRFPVGCAVRAGGAVYTGANVENASYGLTICAERTALVHAVMAGAREVEVVAIASGSTPPAAPCGMCLQSLVEFTRDPAGVRVILVNEAGERRDLTLAELLPHAFTPRQLPGK